MRNEKLRLTILLFISLLLSLYLFFHTYAISIDGAFQYIPIAKDFVSGFYGKALSHNQQPLYALIIALVYPMIGDFELAGRFISTLFGILLIFPVYILGKRLFDQRVAFLSTLLLIIHPYIRRFSADVLKESTYLFFLAIGLWFSWRTIEGEKKYPYLLIPLFSVLAYLVRPDGVEILLVVFFHVLFIKRFDLSGERWKVVLLLLLSSALLLLPYLIHLRESTGAWTLSRSKGLMELLYAGIMKGEISILEKIFFSLKKLNFEFFSVFHPLYLLLLMVGLIRRASSHFNQGEKFLISFFLLHLAVLFLLVLNFTDWTAKEGERFIAFSGRHVLPLLLFSIYWMGEGSVAIFQWITRKASFLRSGLLSEPKMRSTVVFVSLGLLIMAIVLPKTLKPQRYERLPEKWAGLRIKEESGRGMTIFTTLPRVAFYAEGDYEEIDFHKDEIEKLKRAMEEKGALYLAIRESESRDFPEKTKAIQGDFIELAQLGEKGMGKVIVYKRVR